jgi:hypothetical protein
MGHPRALSTILSEIPHAPDDAARAMTAHGTFLQPSGEPNVTLWCVPRFGIYGTLDCDWSQMSFRAQSLAKTGERYSLTHFQIGQDPREEQDCNLLLLLAAIFHAREDGIDDAVARDFTLSVEAGDERGTPGELPLILILKKLNGLAREQRLRTELDLLYAHVPDLWVNYAGGAVPFQAHGEWEGHQFYFRYRHGRASLSVGGNDAVIAPRWTAATAYGDGLSGFLDMDEFIYLFGLLGQRLQTAPQPYVYGYQGALEADHRQVTVYAQDREQAEERARSANTRVAGLDVLSVRLEAEPIRFPEEVTCPRILDAARLKPSRPIEALGEDVD